MKINCLIIDDEPLAIKVLEKHLGEFDNFNVVAALNNPIPAVSLIEENRIDVIFLDINMPKMSGLEFLRTLKVRPKIIITTAYREYAVESFELDVLDYLVKPIPFGRFLKSINKLTQHLNVEKVAEGNDAKTGNSFFFLKVDKKLVKIIYDDIFYIESLKDYIKVFTATGHHLVHKSLTSITEELPSADFLRIHRSFTIAINKVESVEGNLVEINSKRLPIGRKYVNHVKKIILNPDYN